MTKKKDVFVWVIFDLNGIRMVMDKPELSADKFYWKINRKFDLYELFNTSKVVASKKYKLVEVKGA